MYIVISEIIVAYFTSPMDWYRHCEIMTGTKALLFLKHGAERALLADEE
jgi:hypothetical protein